MLAKRFVLKLRMVSESKERRKALLSFSSTWKLKCLTEQMTLYTLLILFKSHSAGNLIHTTMDTRVNCSYSLVPYQFIPEFHFSCSWMVLEVVQVIVQVAKI